MTTYFTSQVAERVASQAVEVFGGCCFAKDYPAEKFFRNSKIGKIYEGTSNMQLATIAKMVIQPSPEVNLSGGSCVGRGLITQTCRQTCDGNILVQRIPMKTSAADPELLALFSGTMQEPRKPCQWYADNSAVTQIDPHGILIEMYTRRSNQRIHPMPS